MNTSVKINFSTYHSVRVLRSFKYFMGLVFINVFFLKNTSILSSCFHFLNLGIIEEILWITYFINECDVLGLSRCLFPTDGVSSILLLDTTMISKKQLQVNYKGPILPEPVNIMNE